MDEPFLPWWLVLLLGMWAGALAVWQHPSVHREIRLWAGLSTLVYLGLIFLALGVRPRVTAVASSHLVSDRIVNFGLAVCIIASLTAGVWMLGRIATRSRHLCYVVLTLSNAGFCFLVRAPELAVGLLAVAGLTSWPLIRKSMRARFRSSRESLTELFRFIDEPVPRESVGEFWLIGGLNGILACALIGTIAYSLRIETSRPSASPRYTALPSRDYLDRIHSLENDSTEKTALLDLAFGQRADVVVLMAGIVFLSLATTLNDLPGQKHAVTKADGILSVENES